MPQARIIPRTSAARARQPELVVFDVELEQGKDTGLFKGSDDGALTFESREKAITYAEAHGFRPVEWSHNAWEPTARADPPAPSDRPEARQAGSRRQSSNPSEVAQGSRRADR